MARPFDGIRLLDLTSGVAGPMAAMLFADLGADVVKIDDGHGAPPAVPPGALTWNRGKRRVALDLRSYEGRAAVHALAATADVALFDALPGELEALGLDSVTLLAENSRLLHTWLPFYGQSGRWSHLPPDDLLRDAVSGIAQMQYSMADQPIALVTPQLGYAHAAIAANAIAAGLWERRQSGRGQVLTVSGLHAFSSVESGGAITAGGVMRATRTSLGGWPHYRLYRCADGRWFFLGCLVAPFFIRALEALDLLDVMTLESVAGEFTNLQRHPGAAEAAALLEAKFASAPREHWLRVLHDAGVPRGPVGERGEWFRSETVAANEMLLRLEHPELGAVEMPGVPVKFSDTPGFVSGFMVETRLEDVLAEPRPQPANEAPAGNSARGRPLAGVRVIDLGAFIAGTFAPTVLANFGADVIKVEPDGGDPFRPYGLISYGHNLGKRSIVLDLKLPAGRAAFDELVRGADVVLDNFRLGVRERLGIDYASLSAINPRIITCSVTAYGPEGALANDPGFDPLVQARSGMMAAQGGADEPVFHQVAVNDSATAMMAAFGVLVALHARELTGRGQEVSTCLANQSVLFQSGELTWYEGRAPAPVGGRDFLGPSALRRFYACAGGWLALACTEARHFHAVCAALGHPEWAGRMTAERAMAEPNAGVLAGLIADVLATMPRGEAIERLLAHGVPAAPALRGDELFSDPWLAANNVFQVIDDPQWGPMKTVRAYASWSRSLGGFPYRAPQTGEHTVEVLQELGYDEERIASLLASGAARNS